MNNNFYKTYIELIIKCRLPTPSVLVEKVYLKSLYFSGFRESRSETPGPGTYSGDKVRK